MGLGFHGVPEEDEDVDLSFGDPGADLLVAAEWATQEPGDGLPQCLLDEGAGGAGSEELMPGEGGLVINGPFDEFAFFVVVSNEGDPLGGAHFPDRSLHAGK